MRLKIVADGRRFFILIPNWLLLNPLSARICARHVIPQVAARKTKAGAGAGANAAERPPAEIGYREVRLLFKALAKSKQQLRGEPLVSVRSSNGERVEIWL